jgi:CheY-like chemotaxis protein
MRDQSLSNVAAVLFDPLPANRQLTRDALLTLGARDLEVPNSLDDARALLAKNDYDLLILDATDDDGQICGAIGDLRHSRLGCNPFIVVLATMWHESSALVRKLLNAGIDDIVLQPVSTGLLQTRIRQQVYARKPFVVTTTYIGPDRRGDHRAQCGDACISVPNSLREKLVGTASPIMIANAVTKARALVNEQRVAQAASKIGIYCALILEAPENSPEAQSDIAMMTSTIADLVRWTNPEQFGALLLHCDKLAKLAEQVGAAQIRRSLGQIAVEARAIQRKLDPRKDDDGLKADVAAAARRLVARRAIEAAPSAATLGGSRA